MQITRQQIIEILNDIPHLGSLNAVCYKHSIDKAFLIKKTFEDSDLTRIFREMQMVRAELIADDILDIADNEEDPYRAKLKIESRKWLASMYAPKSFGNALRIENEHTLNISAALDAATNRVMLSVPNLQIPEVSQIAEIKKDSANSATDSESVLDLL